MAGHELVTEGFKPGPGRLVGDAAQDEHPLAAERINGFAVILRGYASMVGELAGDQWNEGDVSCSVVRRVALPDAFFALDGLLETVLTVLDDFGAFPAVIARELDRYLPFLATTKVLMAAVRAGVGRETAHEAIKEHAVAVALEMREKGAERQRPAGPAGRRLAARAGRGPSRRAAGRPAVVHRRRPRAGRGGGRPRSTPCWPAIRAPRLTARARSSERACVPRRAWGYGRKSPNRPKERGPAYDRRRIAGVPTEGTTVPC